MRLPPKHAAMAVVLLMLTACGSGDTEAEGEQESPPVAAEDANGADGMAARDPAPGTVTKPGIPDATQRPVMQMQVVLERLGFGPGVIDGAKGMTLTNAIKGFQEARNLPVTGIADAATTQALAEWDNIPATRIVTIPLAWGDIAFAAIPTGAAEQAKMAHLGYEDMAEKLAERFHTTPEVLAQLNPGGRPARGPDRTSTVAATTPPQDPADPDGKPASYAPGQQVRVPNIGADRINAATVDNKDWLETLRTLGVGTDQPSVTRILVDESEGWLKAYDTNDQLVALFTVTTGSKNDPLPIGNWTVKGVAYNPPFSFDPELFWDVPDSAEKQRLPPGPNGPVGVVWIDLSKEHYGIHGTPAPHTIGRAQSHGCIRLTNWDAARLAQMVKGGTTVVLQK